VFDFIKALFKPQGSGATAKERLRLVLLSDHLSLAPEMIDALKADLFDVFSRYFEYDAKAAEVTFDHRESEVAMLASVPIQRVRERPAAPAPEPPAAAAPAPAFAAVEAAAVVAVEAEPAGLEAERAPEAAPLPVSAEPPAPAAVLPSAPRPRRRKRKRNAAALNGKPPSPPALSGHSAQA
jgi:cell division topological specificity factor